MSAPTPYLTRSEFDEAVAVAASAAGAYYHTDRLEMDDATYDTLVSRIAATETANPDWVAAGITSQVAAGTATDGDVTHATPMLSLDNTFSPEELRAWWERAVEANGEAPPVVVEPKLDGLAVSATYRNGRLVLVATRGDGGTGEDVTFQCSEVSNLPDAVSDKATFEVRGEMIMTGADFEAANRIRVASGSSPLVNPRNGAAGALRSKSGPRLPLTFAAYELVGSSSYTEGIDRIEALGIGTARSHVNVPAAPCATFEEVAGRVETIGRLRAGLSVGIDGAVIKVTDADARLQIGSGSRAPKWAVAFKYPAEERRTTVEAITVAVGRTGVLTPVAELVPVFVGGVEVSRATLSNPQEVGRKDVRVGDVVWVRRAGDVIPEIVGVDVAARDGSQVPWPMPEACPRCGSTLDRSSRRWRCENAGCGLPEAVAYFASRKAMDIDGLGPAVVEQLVTSKRVGDVSDLYALTRADLLSLDRFGGPRADNLLSAINTSRNQPFDRALCGLGVSAVGTRLSRRLAARFEGFAELCAASTEDLMGVDGIGSERAEGIVADLAELAGVIAGLVSHRIGVSNPLFQAVDVEPTAVDGPFAGMVVCVTGTIPGLNRDEAGAAVEQLGGTTASSVSKRTSLLVAGAGGGSKLAKAEQLGVAVMTAEEFVALLS